MDLRVFQMSETDIWQELTFSATEERHLEESFEEWNMEESDE